jgi:hypothetical protein
MSDRLRWDPELTTARSGTPIYRDGLRLGIAIGAGIIVLGGLLPWAEGRIGFLPKQFGGLDGAADGLILVTLGLVLLFIVRNRQALDASEGIGRWAPLLIGITCLAIWLLGRLSAERAIANWENETGSGSLSIGFWLTGIGVIPVLIFGSYASLRRRDGETSSVASILRMPRRSDLASVIAGGGAIAGAIGGVNLALAMFPAVTVGVPMLFFAGIGIILGAWVGRRLGTLLGKVGG